LWNPVRNYIMRLLSTSNRNLEEFEGKEIPLYAILSHTWGKNEITFQDIKGGKAEEKVEYNFLESSFPLS